MEQEHGAEEEDARPVKLKHRLLAHVYPYQKPSKALLRILHAWVKVGKLPGSPKTHPLLKPKNNWFANIPMNVDFATESQELPEQMLHDLIDSSKYIYILDQCICRTGEDCKDHRHDIGCMFLGATGLDIAPTISHKATREEAYAHVSAAIADGLMPTTMRIRADNYAFLVPDHHTIMAICFCCECCCFMGYYREVPNKNLGNIFHTVPGARLEFDESKCAGCVTHECAEHCYMKNISFVDGKLVRADRCKLCGRCASNCPHDAIRLVTDDAAAFETIRDGALSVADLQGQGTGKKPLPF